MPREKNICIYISSQDQFLLKQKHIQKISFMRYIQMSLKKIEKDTINERVYKKTWHTVVRCTSMQK